SKPAIVIVALGANDGLRHQSVTAMRDNLVEIVGRLRAAGAAVLLVGMRVPPNYGPEYSPPFAAVLPAVPRQTRVPLTPLLLAGVAGVPRPTRPDRPTPTAKGQRIIADKLWPSLAPLLRRSPPRERSSLPTVDPLVFPPREHHLLPVPAGLVVGDLLDPRLD